MDDYKRPNLIRTFRYIRDEIQTATTSNERHILFANGMATIMTHPQSTRQNQPILIRGLTRALIECESRTYFPHNDETLEFVISGERNGR